MYAHMCVNECGSQRLTFSNFIVRYVHNQHKLQAGHTIKMLDMGIP